MASPAMAPITMPAIAPPEREESEESEDGEDGEDVDDVVGDVEDPGDVEVATENTFVLREMVELREGFCWHADLSALRTVISLAYDLASCKRDTYNSQESSHYPRRTDTLSNHRRLT